MKTNYKKFKIIVVDSSIDNSINHIRNSYKNVDIIKVNDVGWAYANNMAIKYAFAKYKHLDYMVFLNNDLIFMEKTWLNKLIKSFGIDPRIGIVGGKLSCANGTQGEYDMNFIGLSKELHTNENKYARYVPGPMFVVRSSPKAAPNMRQGYTRRKRRSTPLQLRYTAANTS